MYSILILKNFKQLKSKLNLFLFKSMQSFLLIHNYDESLFLFHVREDIYIIK